MEVLNGIVILISVWLGFRMGCFVNGCKDIPPIIKVPKIDFKKQEKEIIEESKANKFFQ